MLADADRCWLMLTCDGWEDRRRWLTCDGTGALTDDGTGRRSRARYARAS